MKEEQQLNATWDLGKTNDIGGKTGETHMRFIFVNSITLSVMVLITGDGKR